MAALVLDRLGFPDLALSVPAFEAEVKRRAAAAMLEEAERDLDGIRARCAESFAEFVKLAWRVIEPATQLRWNWHMQAICDHLEAISRGTLTPRLIINVPPGSSKSTIVSVLWQAWEWGPLGRPGMKFLSTSYEIGNVTRDTRKTRDLVLSDWFQRLWPLPLKRAGEASFENEHTGTREGVAFAALTAKRGDRLLIDDPHSLDGAESEPERNKSVRRFIEGGQNRLNDQVASAIVIVMQRLHERDLTGELLTRELGYIHLMIPMEFEPERRFVTPLGWTDPRTYDGELMDPVRFPREAVALLAKDNDYMFAGQYQQRPSPRRAGFIKADMIEIVDAIPGGSVVTWVRGWDLADSTAGDFTAGGLLGKLKDGRWIIGDQIRERKLADQRDALIRSTASQDKARGAPLRISVPKEPAAAGTTLGRQHARMLAGYTVRVTPEGGDKVTRADPLASQINAGNVLMLKGAWNTPLLDEMRMFPAGAFDDQVDSLSRAFAELEFGGRGAILVGPVVVGVARPSPGG